MSFGYIVLLLLIIIMGTEIGGGLYEWRCIYPLWSTDVTPGTIKQRLTTSGQVLAASRFWAYISMSAIVLTVLNVIAAYGEPAATRWLWIAAVVAVFLSRLVTLSFFAPRMMRFINHGDKMSPEQLTRAVRQWVQWSPMRIPVALAAWVALLWIFSHGVS